MTPQVSSCGTISGSIKQNLLCEGFTRIVDILSVLLRKVRAARPTNQALLSHSLELTSNVCTVTKCVLFTDN
jgi:hypothetical protein